VNETVVSKNGVPIRLTDERWAHITEEHCELAGQRVEVLAGLEDPDRILAGKEGEQMAVKEISGGASLVVVYRELENDGFIITAFITSKAKSLSRREQVWPK
jgi:hypothetical protein